MTEQQNPNPDETPDETPEKDPNPSPTIQDHLDGVAVESEESAALAQWNTPDDTPEDRATGYAVYDRTTGQYLPGKYDLDSKPSSTKAKGLVPSGHVAAVVRV